MIFKTFTRDLQEVRDDSMNVILDTVVNGSFPGSQLYLYFRLHTPWEDALDPSDFIADTSLIYEKRLPKGKQFIEILSKYYLDDFHFENIYRILEEAWVRLN